MGELISTGSRRASSQASHFSTSSGPTFCRSLPPISDQTSDSHWCRSPEESRGTEAQESTEDFTCSLGEALGEPAVSKDNKASVSSPTSEAF